MISKQAKEKLASYADKFDPADDPRKTGGKDMRPILCQDCEDEGFVYFNKMIDGTPDWIVVRCVCGLTVIPEYPRSCVGRKLGKVPTWAEIGLTPQEIYPVRLQPLASLTGFLPFPCFEPMKGEIKFRRPIVDQIDPLERSGNQQKYNAKWGHPS